MKKSVFAWFEKYKIHILVWLLFIHTEAIMIGVLLDLFSNPLIYAAHYAVIICYFYLHANHALPWAVKDKPHIFWRLPLVVALQLVCYGLAHYLVSLLLIFVNLSLANAGKIDMVFILRNLYRGLYFMGFATGYYFLQNYLNERKRTETLERERLNSIINKQRVTQELANAKNAFLKAQINPHFLFNTLDFVYHHVNTYSEVAGEAIIKLAEMMRFAMQPEEMNSQISLADEIEQVESLCYLQQIRKTAPLNLEFKYDPEISHLQIIPLVLLTLVENIFKHGDLSKPSEKALISLTVEQGYLKLKTVNLINEVPNLIGTHAGLANIKARLSYAYGDEVQFVYSTIGQIFNVEISIPVGLLKPHA
jgi:two-component system LytT family sensor kinase